MIHTTVAQILSPTQVILAAGTEQGVREGMIFVIYELGNEIFDPETAQPLGRLELVKGRVRVTYTQEKLSHASTLSRREVHVIDPLESLTSHFLGRLARREVEETVFEQLKVDSSVAVQNDLTVRVGDKAHSID